MLNINFQNPVVVKIILKSSVVDFQLPDLGWATEVELNLLPPYPSIRQDVVNFIDGALAEIGIVPFDNMAGAEDVQELITNTHNMARHAVINQLLLQETDYRLHYGPETDDCTVPRYELSVSISERKLNSDILAVMNSTEDRAVVEVRNVEFDLDTGTLELSAEDLYGPVLKRYNNTITSSIDHPLYATLVGRLKEECEFKDLTIKLGRSSDVDKDNGTFVLCHNYQEDSDLNREHLLSHLFFYRADTDDSIPFLELGMRRHYYQLIEDIKTSVFNDTAF